MTLCVFVCLHADIRVNDKLTGIYLKVIFDRIQTADKCIIYGTPTNSGIISYKPY